MDETERIQQESAEALNEIVWLSSFASCGRRAGLVGVAISALVVAGCSGSRDLTTKGHAKEIVVGSYHACAIYEDTTAGCWSLSPAKTMQTAMPVPKLRGVVAIAIASVHACAIVTGGAVKCWSYVDKDMTTPGDAITIEELPAMRSLHTSRWGAAMMGVSTTGATLYWDTRPSRTWFGDPIMATSAASTQPSPWASTSDFETATPEKSRCTLVGTRAECTTWDGASLLVRL